MREWGVQRWDTMMLELFVRVIHTQADGMEAWNVPNREKNIFARHESMTERVLATKVRSLSTIPDKMITY
eukprot:2226469-Amphidinium_carterae.1